MRKLFPVFIASALLLAACGGTPTETSTKPTGADRTYDVSNVAKVDEIAKLLPPAVASKGKLVIGASTDYAPAEFLADDLKTAIGYDVDLGKAIGKVLGVQTEVVNAQFASILPAIGSKYDLGISSFTITAERQKSTNMVSYITVGSSFGVAKGNQKKLDPDKLCGLSIGVQTGTWQFDEATEFAKKCKEAGQPELTVLPYDKQSDVTTNLVGGKLDLMYADSTVTQYAVTLTNGAIEQLGSIRDAAPQGIVIAKTDQALTEAIQKALQHLMDDGTWRKIAANWGIEAAIITKADINPVK